MAGSEIKFFTGRRKDAVARVGLVKGEGKIRVNNRELTDYFDRETLRILIEQPLRMTDSLKKFDVVVRVSGGGIAGQAGAIRHAIARALVGFDEALKPTLKKAGCLTRDAREKERKKYGQRGARARFQFSKR
jgi:small subunit ribosomal protein S9